ncbi:MAG: hypothetical protein COA96_13705 [SAR86 cluster bacterium]|uniref:Antitermination protein NusG n=1 Tax=SAR86 cluster bacterium TaxID=2030880 RepID=A0A2A5AU83_9GAMM|nr:MAG: hypothetical protein COA96_13705 [SAR86 cluster bacterium]
MLGKILLTIAVIVTALFYIRRRDLQETTSKKPKKKPTQSTVTPKTDNKVADDSLSADLRLGAYMFLVLMIGLGGALYYFRWQDDHTILTITLHSDSQAENTQYQVYKYQLQDRSFVTLDGILVTVASTERMEVLGLE